MLGPEQKNRADVRPPCEKTYLHRALDGSRVLGPSAIYPGRWTKRIGRPAEYLDRANGLFPHQLT